MYDKSEHHDVPTLPGARWDEASRPSADSQLLCYTICKSNVNDTFTDFDSKCNSAIEEISEEEFARHAFSEVLLRGVSSALGKLPKSCKTLEVLYHTIST